MDELEPRLRHHLATVDDAALPDADAVWRSALVSGRRLRARRRAVAVVGCAALVSLGATALWAGRDVADHAAGATTGSAVDTVPAVTEPTPNQPETTAAADDAWRPIAADPRGGVLFPSAVWTGSEVISLAGTDLEGAPVAGAAAYSPASDTWRVLADPPLAEGTVDPLVVWTGSELLAIGGTGADGSLLVSAGAAYDPTQDRWTWIASPPVGFVTARSPWAWTGSELLVWPGDGGGPTMVISPIAYDPATDRWRVLPMPPVERRQSAASVWTGSEWLVWGGTTGAAELGDGVAYDPATDAWRVLAPSPLSARRVRAVWTGSEMIVDAGSTGGDRTTGNGEMALADGAAYDPVTDSWRPLAGGLAHPGFVPIWTGRQVVMFAKGSAVVYDAATDTWVDTCCSGGGGAGTPVWTGSVVVVIGSGGSDTGGAVFTPPT